MTGTLSGSLEDVRISSDTFPLPTFCFAPTRISTLGPVPDKLTVVY